MDTTVDTILLCVALICFVIDAFAALIRPIGVNFTALGLALWVLSLLI